MLGNDRYLIEDIPGAQRTQRPLQTVYAVVRLKTWGKLQELRMHLEFEHEQPEGNELLTISIKGAENSKDRDVAMVSEL